MIEVAHFSKISVSFPYLYYQNKKGQIEFATYKGSSWDRNNTPVTLSPALPGTGLTALENDGVIYQAETLGLQHDGGASSHIAPVLPKASAHTSLSSVGDKAYCCIFYTTNKNVLRELLIKDRTSDSTDISDVAPRSNTAAVRIESADGDPDVIHIFYQKGEDSTISEHRYISSKGWKLNFQSI